MMEDSQTTHLVIDHMREEYMLRRKATILEEFLRNGIYSMLELFMS
jgi:hypothetical protein